VADELRKIQGIEVETQPGGTGTFDVIVDGKTVFSKREVGYFPEPGEMTRIIEGLRQR
jgi:selT/selW/selH-like putative selenoprotein